MIAGLIRQEQPAIQHVEAQFSRFHQTFDKKIEDLFMAPEKKNPALMTMEISEYADQSGDFKYHITSLMPLNPFMLKRGVWHVMRNRDTKL